jgi:hypothetical protein
MVRRRNREMPNLFVIGAMKSGTTSLHRYLDLHPEISMSLEKEPNFFVTSPPPDLAQQVADRDAYLGLFRAGTPIRGEASHRYTQFPYVPGVPAEIAAVSPEARLIYLVRDPVARLESQAREVLSARMGEAKYLPPDMPVSELVGDLDDPANRFVCLGRYMTQIRQYLEHFPRESLLVVDSDRLRSRRRDTMAKIFGFIGVDEEFWDDRMDVEHYTAEEKGRRSEGYVRLSEVGLLKTAVDRMPPRIKREVVRLARSGMSKPWTPPQLDDDLRFRLECLYRPEAEDLREFTGRNFAGWSI